VSRQVPGTSAEPLHDFVSRFSPVCFLRFAFSSSCLVSSTLAQHRSSCSCGAIAHSLSLRSGRAVNTRRSASAFHSIQSIVRSQIRAHFGSIVFIPPFLFPNSCVDFSLCFITHNHMHEKLSSLTTKRRYEQGVVRIETIRDGREVRENMEEPAPKLGSRLPRASADQIQTTTTSCILISLSYFIAPSHHHPGFPYLSPSHMKRIVHRGPSLATLILPIPCIVARGGVASMTEVTL